MKKIIPYTISFCVLIFSVISMPIYGQTAVQGFGHDTKMHSSPIQSTDFLPNPEGGGTTYARAGAAEPNAPIYLDPTSNPLMCDGSYARAVASSTTAATKLSPIVGYDASTQFYTSMKLLLGDADANDTATSGTWVFTQGSGNIFSNNGGFLGAQSFAALQFVFQGDGTVKLMYRNIDKWSNDGLLVQSINQASVHTLEIFANNNIGGKIHYTYDEVAQSIAPGTFDLYLNGLLIGDDLAKSQLPDGHMIESMTFIGTSSVGNVANVFLDDIYVYNEIPGQTITPVPSITITEQVIPNFQAEVGNSDKQSITIDGINLTDDIMLDISGENADLFTLSEYTIMQEEGIVAAHSLLITYTPTAEGKHTALLSLNSSGIPTITKRLNAVATNPPVVVTVPAIIITEVYGGGGNSGATYSHDFIELYNTSNEPVDIGGWSIQYYTQAGDGTSKNLIVIPEGKSIDSNSYFLIQASGGGEHGDDLPMPDLIADVAMAAAGGKVVLYNTDEAQTIDKTQITSITDNEYFKDYVPFGKEAVPIWGSAMLTNPSASRSAGRKVVDKQFVYTQSIGNDFENQQPNPQNSNLTTVTKVMIKIDIVVKNNLISFNAVAGQLIEMYDIYGQKVYTGITNEGYNTIKTNEKGVVILKIGDYISKLIL